MNGDVGTFKNGDGSDPSVPARYYTWSSEAESGHFPYMGEAVRATERTGKNFAGKGSQVVLQIFMHFCYF